MTLTREMTAAFTTRTKELLLPELNCSVFARELRIGEAMEFERRLQTDAAAAAHYAVRVGAINADGYQVYGGAEDEAIIANLPAKVVSAIAGAVRELTGYAAPDPKQ